MLKAKTKRYEVPVKKYTMVGMQYVFIKLWWVFLIPVVIASMAFVFPKGVFWWVGVALFLTILYAAFWYIQFAIGMPRLEQTKLLFEKLSYEVEGKQLIIKRNQREGMMITFDKIKEMRKTKTEFILTLSLVQHIILPFDIFNSPADLKYAEAIFDRRIANKTEPKA